MSVAGCKIKIDVFTGVSLGILFSLFRKYFEEQLHEKNTYILFNSLLDILC